MSKIVNVIIDNNNNKIFVGYDSGKSKMYMLDNIPTTVKNYIDSDNAIINYVTATAEQEQETTTEAEATAEQPTAEQRQNKIIKVRKNFYIATTIINNIVPVCVLETINEKNRFKGNTKADYYYYRKTEEQETAEAEQAYNRSRSRTAEAETIRNNLTIANSGRHNIFNAVMTAKATAKAAAEAAEQAEEQQTATAKATAKAAAEAAEQAAAVLRTEAIKATAEATATAEEATKIKYEKSNFEEIQNNFYKCYKAFKALKATATATEAAETKKAYAKAIDVYCMILVLSVLKKIENVSRTGRTDKTKADTNYYAIRNIKNDLIVTHNAINQIISNIENNVKMSVFDFNALIEKSFAADGIELLSVAKEKLLTLIAKAEAAEIPVNTADNNFLDIRYDYVDINKKVWNDIQTTTYIETVTEEQPPTAAEAAEAAAEINAKAFKQAEKSGKTAAEITAAEITKKYTVKYLSGRTAVFYNINLPKTAIDFLENENALKNGCYDKQKHLYLTKRNTCIATEIHKAVRSYIQSEKTITTNNSYCYLADVTTITDSNSGKTYNFDTYKKIEKYNTALMYNNNNEIFTSETDNSSIEEITKQLNLKSDNYKKVFKYALQGYNYPTIAKKTGIKENTAKSSLREIRKKILLCDIIGNYQKFNSLKNSIKELNRQRKQAEAAAAEATATAEEATAEAEALKAKAKAAAAVIRSNKRSSSRKYKIKYVTFGNCKVYLISKSKTKKVTSNFYIMQTVKTIPTAAAINTTTNTIITVYTTAKATAAEATATAEAAEAKATKIIADIQTYITDIQTITATALTEQETAIYNTISEAEKILNTCISIKHRTGTEEETAEQKRNRKFIDIINTINNAVRKFLNASDIEYILATAATAEEAAETEAANRIVYSIRYKTATAKTAEQQTAEQLYNNSIHIKQTATEKNKSIIFKQNKKAFKTDSNLTEAEQQYLNVVKLQQKLKQIKKTYNEYAKIFNLILSAEADKIEYIETTTAAEAAKHNITIALNTFNLPTFRKLRYNAKNQKKNSKQQILNYRLNTNNNKIVYNYITDNSGNKYSINKTNSRTADSNNIFITYTEYKKNIPVITAEAAEKAENKSYFATASKRSYNDNFITNVYPLLLFVATTKATTEVTAEVRQKYNINNISMYYKYDYSIKLDKYAKYKNLISATTATTTDNTLTKLDSNFFKALKSETTKA